MPSASINDPTPSANSYTPLVAGEGQTKPKSNNCKTIAAVVIILVITIVVCVAVFMTTSDSEDCFYWEDEYYCPGDCVFQNGAEYCPDGVEERAMLVYTFEENPDGICNDGTKPRHYYRESLPGPHENDWIFRFEGGNSCFSPETCEDRASGEEAAFMTTAAVSIIYEDPEGGFFNGSPDKNPFFHDYHMISGHYCTSDAWSGTNPADGEGNDIDIHFMGHANVIGMFMEAKARWDLDSARRCIVFGFSAGGIGVMAASESIKEWFDDEVPNAELLFLMDSSWFLASLEPWGDMTCDVQSNCDLETQMIYALDYWKPVYSENCADAGLDWECMIPEYSFYYQTTGHQFFILQNYYDTMQANLHTSDTAAISVGDQPDWWWEEMANITFSTLTKHIDGYFISNCENHDNLNRNWMYEIWVNDTQSSETMTTYWDVHFPAGTKLQIHDDWLDEDGAPCISCNPTCPPENTIPPHTHELEDGGGR